MLKIIQKKRLPFSLVSLCQAISCKKGLESAVMLVAFFKQYTKQYIWPWCDANADGENDDDEDDYQEKTGHPGFYH